MQRIADICNVNPKSRRSTVQSGLPLESDLSTLLGIQNYVNEIIYGDSTFINPDATFANSVVLPPPQKPAPRPLIIPRVSIPVPKTPVNIPAPRPAMIKQLPALQFTTFEEPIAPKTPQKTPQKPQPRLVLMTVPPPAGTPPRSGIPDKIEIPTTPTRLEPIPLPEPQESQAQLQTPQTSSQNAVMVLNSIDWNKLSGRRATKGGPEYYTHEQMKAIARSLGILTSVGKAALYQSIRKMGIDMGIDVGPEK